MIETICKIFLNFSKRAEKIDKQSLIDSFVDVGPLFSSLATTNNQILYGRRGTGKTHALVFLGEQIRDKGDLPIYIDLRNIGSTGGLYSDNNILLSERATRLIVDVLATLNDEIVSITLDDFYKINLNQISPVLDNLSDAISHVIVKGEVQEQISSETATESCKDSNFSFKVPQAETMAVEIGHSNNDSNKLAYQISRSGNQIHRVHFGEIGSILERLIDAINGRKIWILLDEWSAIPIDLQPYLADLIRRAFFPISNIVVKIAAIEKRSHFQLKLADRDYIGIELGSDASADINMDDFMVFDNDESKSIKFYQNLVYRHFVTIAKHEKITNIPQNETELFAAAFSQENVFKEFVRAAEGIPRDAFSILSQAAQSAFNQQITMETIRKCSKLWYQRDKESAVSSNPNALALLHWIIDNVIGKRKARAFLLQNNQNSPLIDTLFDSRVLHLLKRNISAIEQPGLRFDVYKIDYGCYVDLLLTIKAPSGLLQTDEGSYIEVPTDDYRAIRRAVLHLSEFDEFLKLKAKYNDAKAI
jgi:hypothetical protein